VYKFLSHKTLCKLSKISLFTSFTFYEKTPFSSAMKGCFFNSNYDFSALGLIKLSISKNKYNKVKEPLHNILTLLFLRSVI
ncbi:hypothetical protein, partial [Priestia megaterium]|uniref:hypothetical protein n=1 Tax=Priestia megaterium TaxID=1404 RepID=UPI002FFE0492